MTSAAGRVGSPRGFWLVAFAFVVATAFTAVPTPLYPIYQERQGLSTFTVTVVYAVYAGGVLVSLLAAGHVSDWVGRRRPVLAGLAVEGVAALVFVLWPTLPGVLTGRVLTGLGIGIITATAAAHLTELHAAARPGADRRRSDMVAAGASMAGFAVGPLISGLLAEFVPAPLVTPYLVLVLLLAVAGAGVALVPETVVPAPDRPVYRVQRVAVPVEGRTRYVAAAAAGFGVLAVLGLFASLAPTFVGQLLDEPSRAVAGAVVCMVMTAALLGQVLLDRWRADVQLVLAVSLVLVGMPAVVVSVVRPSLWLFLVGGALAGAGSGPLLKGAVSTVIRVAPPSSRGEALAGFYLVGYLGLAVPVVGLGVATLFVASEVALAAFTWAVLIVVLVAGHRLVVGARADREAVP